jgi:ABC-2 type transport system permease protein
MREILVSPAKRLYIMIGRTLGGATTGLFQGLIVLIICLFIGIDFSVLISLPLAICFMILLAFLFTAIGILIASVVNDFQGFQFITSFLIMPLLFLSGAMYPLTTTGTVLQTIAKANPLAYAVDGIRRALTGQTFFSPRVDALVLIVLMVATMLLGAYFFSRMKADN